MLGSTRHPIFWISFIVLLEGFVTISAEILTIRQLIPFVGSSVVVTSIIIGVFLLFLAYGYRRGGRVTEHHARVLMRNFLISAFLLGIGLSYIFLFFWFYHWQRLVVSDLYPLISYLLLVTAPLVYLLGQTVPLSMHLFPATGEQKAGELGGKILHLSTLGSFLGAVLTSVLLFSLLGVAWTVFINVMILLGLALLLFGNRVQLMSGVVVSLFLLPLTFYTNISTELHHFIKTNHYANYRVSTFVSPTYAVKQFEINNTYASMVDSRGQTFPYLERIKSILFQDLQFRNKDILILGAGGFSLSMGAPDNRFVYVDIDPDIKPISEEHFSGKINGEFVAQDARLFVNQTDEKFDAVIVDAFNSPLAIPQHLLTIEYFDAIKRIVKPDGVVIINFIGQGRYTDPYSKHVDNTIRDALGYCVSTPESYGNQMTNIVYVCYPRDNDGVVYSDDLNNATLDAFNMKH